MSRGWVGPAWGEPSKASQSAVPLRARAGSLDACYRADGGESADFAVMAASVAGVGHRLAGRRCEDAYGWAFPAPGRLALVIADGVSTAGRGGEGAELAVSAACNLLVSSDNWGQMDCEAALRAASAEVVRVGGASAIELSTTLVVALLSSTEEGAEVALARVGDSTAFVLQDGKWSELFPDPDEEAMRGTVVEVLPLGSRPGAGSMETSSVTLLADSALVLLTDGVADPLRDGPGTVAPALAEVLQGGFSGDLSPLDLVAAADFSRRGCQDDRTVLVAWRPRPAPRWSEGRAGAVFANIRSTTWAVRRPSRKMTYTAAVAAPAVASPVASSGSRHNRGFRATSYFHKTWSTPAAFRALRATIVMPCLFALCLEVFHNPQMATFASFGSFATLLFAAFGGTRVDKLVAHAGLAVTGSVLIVIGTSVSGHVALAAVVTVLVAFCVLFAGIAGPNAASGGTAALVAYVLPASSPAAMSVIPDRLAGWWLASAVGTAAVLILAPRPPGDRLRASAAACAQALADQLDGALAGRWSQELVDATMKAKLALHAAFDAAPVPAHRPGGPRPGSCEPGRVSRVVRDAGLRGGPGTHRCFGALRPGQTPVAGCRQRAQRYGSLAGWRRCPDPFGRGGGAGQDGGGGRGRGPRGWQRRQRRRSPRLVPRACSSLQLLAARPPTPLSPNGEWTLRWSPRS